MGMGTDSTVGREWRQRLSSVRYGQQLRELDLSGLTLQSIALPRHVFFDRCCFASADLRQATFDECSFKLCDFKGADLRGASLRGASFSGCDLSEVDLRGADLFDARFGAVGVGAGARPTRLRNARLDVGALTAAHLDASTETPQ